MVRRGDELRDHILWTAKDIFLEFGFERASMDVVASRAQTSKRSLYAHFGSKEKLFIAIVELVRALLLDPLGKPEDYSDHPIEALTRFCARYAEALNVCGAAQMFRLNAAEATRFPEGAAHYYGIVFAEVQARIAGHIGQRIAKSRADSEQAAEAIMAQVLYPRLLRSVFGLGEPRATFAKTLSPDFDLAPIRQIVLRAIEGFSTGSQ